MDMIFIELQKDSDIPLYQQIYNQIKQDMIDGKFPVGMKLPSKRQLEEFLGVSQTTIEMAYDQLTAEGFIAAEPRKGYFVQAIEELAYVQPVKSETVAEIPIIKPIHYDFSPSSIDTENFPFIIWRKYARDIMDTTNAHLLLLGDPHGDIELRQEIARYLYHSRGVDCTPEQIIVGSGTEQLLPLIIRILGEWARYAIEDPGYLMTKHVFSEYYKKTIPIAVDHEGLDVKALQRSDATIAYVTPSHQFPTGTVLSAARRTALLNWAASNPEFFIIEDDYDSEFRYRGRPIPSLQGMDKGENVIYLSTFTKSLMPSMRIAYMVLPPRLLDTYRQAFIPYSSSVPRIDQHILARFMADGQFSRHLNRMRKIYRRKMHTLTNLLKSYEPTISFSGDEAGMHVLLHVHTNRTEKILIDEALQSGIKVRGLDTYKVMPDQSPPSFLIGFGGLTEEDIKLAIPKLLDVWNIKKTAIPE
ncbi:MULTISPECIES: PLP-dependent aminotransferase family protein [unclassified Sporosarcina]|uniref:MocR-like pyridoxine biosynthesis transcription factor PdxR n=1 Tax=unclassified Sporosarcina TaxID=2647733 RepID=UPI000C16744C|nr:MULTISPECIES: PLP-dependent aminotransferase family protein [unclassified Sporosarcina]PID04408.1 GntR family transcriptional regulator [Sporosarcina sp. P30]PID07551.1 GntR family transcriptional regulator [Sporosarcina sp. P31]PID10758.1 GntR family transcriptional regulator [Sporosarcina sp. P32b]